MNSAIKILHFTDSHLTAEEDKVFNRVNPDLCLQGVLRHASAHHPDAALALFTGDLADAGSEHAYHRLNTQLKKLAMPVYCLPGNHDDSPVMQAELVADNISMPRSVDIENWRITLLDSTVPGIIGGRLSSDELQWLDEQLNESHDRHALVCLHHPPMPSGCQWLDETMLLDNPAALFAVLDRFPAVRAVLWGHIHQEFDDSRKGVRYLSSPSTMAQFKPGCREFTLDDRPPGYRWLLLHGDGTIDTGVVRVD